MQATNFTLSDNWIKGIRERHLANNIVDMSGIYFLEDNNVLKCQHFFDFELSNITLDMMKKCLDNGAKIKFSYLDKSNLYNQLKNWCDEQKYNFYVVDEWLAPRLELIENTKSIENYLRENKNTQIKRNYKQYLKYKDNYNIVYSNKDNCLDLWENVLYIDYNSWKGQERCDMKSLNREDLQYIFYLIQNNNDASLSVLYKDNVPLAYSLMFRANKNAMWYAVKWGASNEGRKEKGGFYCLFNHLERIYYENQKINLDFWGRRSQTYDYLKNNEIIRTNIEIGK